jgi:hypothetical protein
MFAVENETWCLATAAGISMKCVHECWSNDDFLAGTLVTKTSPAASLSVSNLAAGGRDASEKRTAGLQVKSRSVKCLLAAPAFQ